MPGRTFKSHLKAIGVAHKTTIVANLRQLGRDRGKHRRETILVRQLIRAEASYQKSDWTDMTFEQPTGRILAIHTYHQKQQISTIPTQSEPNSSEVNATQRNIALRISPATTKTSSNVETNATRCPSRSMAIPSSCLR